MVEAAVKQAGGAPKTGSRVTGPRAVILRAAATLGRLAMQHKTLAELQMSVDDAVLALQQLSFLVELLCDLPEVCGARANVALDDGTKAALRKLQQFRQKQMTQSTLAVNNGG